MLCCAQMLSNIQLFQPHGLQPTRLLFMGFPGQEYWSALPFSSSGDLSSSGIKSVSLALAVGFFTTEPLGKPKIHLYEVL